jgi:hypothetical protein
MVLISHFVRIGELKVKKSLAESAQANLDGLQQNLSSLEAEWS